MNVKRKGNAGERELLSILTENGIDACRNDQTYIGGKNNPDISAVIGGFQFHVEVKRCERLNLTSAIKQAVSDADGKAFPVVAHRSNRQPWLISCRLEDLCLIFRWWKESQSCQKQTEAQA